MNITSEKIIIMKMLKDSYILIIIILKDLKFIKSSVKDLNAINYAKKRIKQLL